MQHKHLLIYKDKDVAASELKNALAQSFYAAVMAETNGLQIKQEGTLNDNTLALFLPGIIGEDSPYSAQLGAEGNKAIREYVEDGGVFVGICAGAFYAANRIVYDPPWRSVPKTSSPGLDFFSGLARGPIHNLARFSLEEGLSDCTVTKVRFNRAADSRLSTGVAYGNGPMLFPDDSTDLEVLARYEDVAGSPIAMAVQKVGKGLAFFVGVLPYIAPTDMKLTDENRDIALFNENLKPHEDGRKEIWDNLIYRIKKHNADLGRVRLLPTPTKSLS